MALHQRYNNENILSRAVIAGLLNILNNKITYEQVWSNEDIETIQIPWFYNMSGDERFMQDFYTHYAHCLPPKPVDGNFDMIPRGIIKYSGSIIDSARTTSRYIQGNFLKEVDGQLQTYRAFLYPIPLNMNFDCEIWFDTQITSLKVEQVIREVFYKTITFYVYYKGMRVGCSVGFPEDYTLEKNIQYSFETANATQIKILFNLQVETYQPVFDNSTEVNANEYMTGLAIRLVDKNMKKHDGNIIMTSDYEGLTIAKGQPLLLEWDYINENAIINKVDILWSDLNSNVRNIIEKEVPNHEFYLWNIPETFTAFKSPIIIWPADNTINVYRPPLVRILPDATTKIIDSSSFDIIDPGYFLSTSPDISAYAVLEMRNTLNKVVYSGDASIYFTLKDNKLNSFTLPYGNIIFPGDVPTKQIDIYVVNSVTRYSDEIVNTEEPDAFGVIHNVTIL